MPHIYDFDLSRTLSYIPKVSSEPYLPVDFVQSFKNVESRGIHEGRTVDPQLIAQEQIDIAFHAIGFDSLLTINEQICPRFILEYFREIKIKRNQDNSISFRAWVGSYRFSLSLKEFAQILEIPCQGQCAYSYKLELNSLVENREEEGPYLSYIPSQTELISLLCNSPDVLCPKRIRIRELRRNLQPMAIILRENALSIGRDREYLPACCAHMLYCILTRQPYNLSYLFAMRIMHFHEHGLSMPYGMFLTRLYRYFIYKYPYLQGPQYHLVDHVLEPINESHISSFLKREKTPIDDLLKERMSSSAVKRIWED